MRTLFTSAALAALLLGIPAPTRAQESPEDAEITRMAKEHYKLGLDAFKAARYPEAIKELKKAYLLKRLPPLLVNIAKTYDKLNDVDNEIYYYKKYLAEAPTDAKDRDLVKKTVEDLENRKAGRAPAGGESSAETPPAETPVAATPRPRRPVAEESPAEEPPPEAAQPRATGRTRRPAEETPPAEAPPPSEAPPPAPPAAMPAEWAHTPIDSVPPGKPVDVRVSMPVMKGVKVYMYYRSAGQADFTPVEMRRHGAEKVARIPSNELSGKSIQYYVEAKDKAGAVVKNSGSQTDPNIVMIDPDAAPQMVASYKPRSDEPSEEPTAGGEEPAASPPGEETPPQAKKHSLDDEQAPLGPGATAAKSEDKGAHAGKGGGPKLRLLTILGLVGVGAGVLAAGGLGTFGLVQAGRYAQAVTNDACPNGANCPNPKMPYIFNDPGTKDNDKSFQDRGHLYNIIGLAGVGAGVGLALAGGALLIVDFVKSKPAPAPKAHRRRPKPAPAPDAPAEEPPPETSGSIRNFIAAPIVSPTTVGLGAGFNF